MEISVNLWKQDGSCCKIKYGCDLEMRDGRISIEVH